MCVPYESAAPTGIVERRSVFTPRHVALSNDKIFSKIKKMFYDKDYKVNKFDEYVTYQI